MHSLDLPLGSPVRLTATARPKVGVHRWDVRVLTSADGAPRLAYGSEIGGRDCDQGVDIPAQDADCQVEVCARHMAGGRWEDDQATVTDDTPSRLQIGFSDPQSSGAQSDDVLLSFTFRGALSPTGRR